MSNYNKQGKPDKQDKFHLKIQTTAPYNFIPLVKLVLLAEEFQKTKYSCIDTAKNTGEIHITLKAETPIFVSDKEKNFFKGANGKETIPGSSIKGMVRSNMQILGYDKINHDMDDEYSIYFRDMTGSSSGMYKDLKEYYKNSLGIVPKVSHSKKTNKKSTYSVAEKVKAGYLVKENGTYTIYPCEQYYRVSPEHEIIKGLQNPYFHYEAVWYEEPDGSLCKEFALTAPQNQNMYKLGTLFCSGKAVGLANSKYIFPAIDRQADPIAVTEEDILSYKIDYKMRARVKPEGATFWHLPEDNETKPVFYLRDEGQTHFGMTQFLRIAYKHSLHDGIYESHKNNQVTFVESILGYTNKGDNENESQASKVYFGDFTANPPIVTHPPFMAILGQPKPSFFPAYTKKGEHFSVDGFELRGRKHYWLKAFQKPQQEEIKINVATTLRPLNTGSTFTGVIKYKNLSDAELGLLLWSLRLEEGCYQSIGMGKSLGMGRVSLVMHQLKETNNDYSFESFTTPFVTHEDTATVVNDYIEQYKSFLKTALGGKSKTALEKRMPLKEFFAMHSTIIQNVDNIKDMGLRNNDNYYMNRYIDQVDDVHKDKAKKDDKGNFIFDEVIKQYSLVLTHALQEVDAIIALETTEEVVVESETLEEGLEMLSGLFGAEAKFGNNKNKKKKK